MAFTVAVVALADATDFAMRLLRAVSAAMFGFAVLAAGAPRGAQAQTYQPPGQSYTRPPYGYQPPPYSYTPPTYTYKPPATLYRAPGYRREPYRSNSPDYNRAYRYPPSAYGDPHRPRRGDAPGGFWSDTLP
ncbi:MAG: hypothetical protein KIT16_17855 [Rhodospirillaceae bacterium]|nr:hypothetical protein [Rhodospirillaceae bacterium]